MSIHAVAYVLDLPAERCKGAARLVAIALANHASDDTGECWPSIARIGQQAGLNEQTVKRCLRELEAHGVIVRTVNGAPDSRIPADRRPNLYRFPGLTGGTNDTPRHVDNPQRGVQRVPDGGYNEYPTGGTNDTPRHVDNPQRGVQRVPDGGYNEYPTGGTNDTPKSSENHQVIVTLSTRSDTTPAPRLPVSRESLEDALFTACWPHLSAARWRDALGRTDQSRLQTAARDLAAIGVTADEVQVRADRARAKWTDGVVTPRSLEANWSTLAVADTEPALVAVQASSAGDVRDLEAAYAEELANFDWDAPDDNQTNNQKANQ